MGNWVYWVQCRRSNSRSACNCNNCSYSQSNSRKKDSLNVDWRREIFETHRVGHSLVFEIAGEIPAFSFTPQCVNDVNHFQNCVSLFTIIMQIFMEDMIIKSTV